MSRILLVSEAKGVGGAEVYLERLAASIPGHRFTLAVPARLEETGWPASLRRGGVRVESWSGDAGGLPRLGRLARDHDLVHLNLPSTYDGGQGLLAAAVGMFSGGVPLVTTEHLTRIPRSRRRRITKLATLRAVRIIITVSEASRRALVAEGVPASRIAVIPNGIPDTGPPLALPSGDPTLRIAVLATLEPRKQLDLLFRAAAATRRPIRIDVAGNGPLRDELQRLASDLGGLLEVHLHGRVENPRGILDASHLLALPSRLEAMPLSVLEALGAGRGVLVSALPGMEEIVIEGRTGRLLSSDDPDSWTSALREQADDPGLRRAWSEEARADYERRFTLERCAARTAEVYARFARPSGERP